MYHCCHGSTNRPGAPELGCTRDADDADEGYPVILTCNGLVIAGRIVSGLTYATAVGEVDPFLNSLP